MKKLLMIATIALLAVACNKNQAAVKKFDGTWNATSMTTTSDGVSIDLIGTFVESATFDFDGCKLKDEEFCNIITTVVFTEEFGGGSDTQTGLYRVTGDGTKLEQKEDASSTTVDTMEIVELTKSRAELKQTDEDGAVTVVKLEKK